MLGASITMIVFLGKFAFNNPNPEAIYGIGATGAEDLWATMELAEAAKATELDDVHAHFVTWFLWGFIQSLLPCAIGICTGLLSLAAPAAALQIGGCAFSGSSCAGLAWYITGLVFRCRQSGNFASGDIMPAGSTMTEDEWITAITADDSTELYQYASGNFIWLFYVIGWIIMGSCCGLACCGAIITACCASR